MKHNEILTSLNDIISNNPLRGDVYNIFQTAYSLIKDGTIELKDEPKMTTLLGGMGFNPSETVNPQLIFGQKYLDTYAKKSSIHHTILIHELKHIFDYSSNPNAFSNCTPKQRHWYEFAARQIEVDFITHYLKDKFKLSRCEELLLDSFANDDLDCFTTLFERVSIRIYTIFRTLETEYHSGETALDTIIQNFFYLGSQLIGEYEEPNDDFTRYTDFVRVKSFRDSLEDLILTKDGEPQILFKDIHMAYRPIINPIYDQLYSIIDTYYAKNKSYLASINATLEQNYMLK